MSAVPSDSIDESYDPSKLIVNYLPLSMTNIDLKELFAPYGNVEEAKIVLDRMTKVSRGYGFVKFSTPEEAEKAVGALNGKTIDTSSPEAKPIHVAVSKPPKVEVNLYVGNLLPNAKNEDLKAVFSRFGTVVECNIPYDRSTNASKGFGFVRVDSKTAANKAIAGLNGVAMEILSGTAPLTVKRAENNGAHGGARPGRFVNPPRYQQPMINTYSRPPVTYDGVCVFAYNIPPNYDERRLSELFRKYGTVLGARVMRKPNRQSKGFGFVNMSTMEEANIAIENLNGRPIIPERPLQVSLKKQ